ncbi:MAG TPA: flagellar biosynthetic protein FliR [Stellaceae bacterium]|nr:flagellar biosynthetic protein FliR [Stellaceae bacterium]
MLDQILPANLFAAALVFARLGSALMLMPGIGDTYVASRFRLVLALAMTAVATPIVAPMLPALPTSPIRLALMLCGEIAVGLFLGSIARVLLAALEIAGTVISIELGLSAALVFNPLQQTQEAITSAFYSVAGVVIIFLTDLHHPMLKALVASYSVFHPGAGFYWGDFSDAMARAVADSFRLGIEIAAPFIMLGTMFYVAVGLLSRLAPQLQILFVIQPLQIVAGLTAFALLVGSGLQWFLERYAASFANLIGVGA